MKILFNYGGSYVYGKERYALNLMHGVQSAGHEIFNIANGWNDGHFIHLLNEAAIPHATIKLGKISRSLAPEQLKWTIDALLHLPLALIKFRRLIKIFDPDIIVFESCYNYYFLKKFCCGRKILIEYHEDPNKNFWLDQILKSEASKSIAHVGVSKFICSRLLAKGCPENKVFPVFNSYRDLPKLSMPTPTSGEKIILGFAGQINKRKGIEDLIVALGFINGKVPFDCCIVGNGDPVFIEYLKAKCRDLGIINQISWLGYLKNMQDFYKKIQLCIVPSRVYESFGRIPMEAGLYAVPSIVTNRGGLPEIVLDSSTGFIVPSYAPEAIAEKITIFYKNPSLLQKMGLQARSDYSARFSLDRQVGAFTEICHRTAADSWKTV